MNNAERFGEAVAKLRREAGLTQTELGKRAAMSPEEIDLLEHGEAIVTLDVLVKMAGSLGIPLDDLIFGRGSREGDG